MKTSSKTIQSILSYSKSFKNKNNPSTLKEQENKVEAQKHTSIGGKYYNVNIN